MRIITLLLASDSCDIYDHKGNILYILKKKRLIDQHFSLNFIHLF